MSWHVKIYFACTLLLTAQAGFAQNKRSKMFLETLEEANAMFDAEDFRNAQNKYRSVYHEDPGHEEMNLSIAICKYRLKEPPDSIIPFLRKADKSKFPEAQLYEARVLHLQHQFDEAIEHYKKYKKFRASTREVKNDEIARLIRISERARERVNNPVRAIIKNLGPAINTKYPEYVPLISADESVIYFTSRRPGSTGDSTDAWGNYFEDVYVSYQENGQWSAAKNLGEPLNTPTHDACAALSGSAKQMIIYRTSADGLSGDLYLTEAAGGGWGEPRKLGPEVNTPHKELSACFSPDGNSIVFSSDRPGGLGGKDLYRVVKLPNDKWSLPSNLGKQVNTKYDEDAPFISADGSTLYFSSKGHETIGEYDIFKSAIKEDGSFGKTEGIGYPVNTVGDDIYFVVNANAKHGYYSSLNENHGEAGYASEDLYMVDMHYDVADVLVRRCVALDARSGQPVSAKITLVDKVTNKVSGLYRSSAKTGSFIIVVNPYNAYKLTAEIKDHSPVEINLPAVAEHPGEAGEEELIKILFAD